MWIIDLTFLQESADIFEEYFINKKYKITTYSGKIFLIVNTVKNYPHLIGVHSPSLGRLRGSEFFFNCIKDNNTSEWTNSMKHTFNRIYPDNIPYGNNDIKITFFPLMPEIFINDNYIISVNYDKDRRTDHKSFDTELLISDFNDGMSVGMVEKDDGTFGFNSWRVEENEEALMDLYSHQEIDLIKTIEQYEDDKTTFTKAQTVTKRNLWRLSRLVRSYDCTIIESDIKATIDALSHFDDSEFEVAMQSIN